MPYYLLPGGGAGVVAAGEREALQGDERHPRKTGAHYFRIIPSVVA